jgi:dipeptidyl-peptidase-4
MKRFIVILAFLLLVPAGGIHAQEPKKRLAPELIVQEGALISPGISNLRWRPGGDQLTYTLREGSGKDAVTRLWLYDIETKNARLLLDTTGENRKLSLGSYQWSPQGNALLLQGDNDLWLFDVNTGRKRRLTQDALEEEYPAFSPGGDRVAFVKQNNLYVLELDTGRLQKLSDDGNENVLNGKLDWVYEEELAYRAAAGAFEWSPDGKKIAYLRLDDNPVPQYPLVSYLQVHAALTRQRFPQSGDPNPLASIHVVTVGGQERQSWSLAAKSPQVEYVGPTFSWTPDSSAVTYLTLNRAQNELQVRLWDPASGSDRQVLVEKDPYWINSLVPPRYLEGGQRFLWLSERDGWLHLYLYNHDGELLKQLTRGNWQIELPAFGEVPNIAVDEKAGWAYFEANQKDPRERQLYRVRLDGSGFECLSKEAGTHTMGLSPNGAYLADASSSFDTPPQTRLLKTDGSLLALLDQPKNHLGEYQLAQTEFLEVKARDGAKLYARLVKPADFDPKKRYPVIVDIYGGPHTQVVTNRWGVTSMLDHLFAQEGFLVWALDNRGSSGRGHAWESTIFENMGRLELDDQLDGVAYLKSLPYVDGERLGIWGWSYGGYMVLYALTHAPEVFKCGVAGGPVTDWKFYDSIYTERYMRTPQENPQGYKTSSPLEAADKLQARVLLIHGTDDDNVHMQNTMNFVEALVRAQRPFELYLQPGQKHGFGGAVVRSYLNERVLSFFEEYLKP